ncbi:GNAT family N-acetyltransferase [Candidatus Pelagibacter sp.]|nr:GNAT family N-acetyltransferase [Candidatus Pelagibacter sp.]
MKNKIKATQVILKELTISDYSIKYLNWMKDKKINEFTEQKLVKQNKKRILDFIKEKRNSKKEFLYGIYLKLGNNSKHVGNIKLGSINFYHKNAYISYFIGDKNFWGMNIATISIKKVLLIAKNKFKLKKITACTYKINVGSMKVLKKNGFSLEASFKKHLIYKNKRVDEVYYAKFL